MKASVALLLFLFLLSFFVTTSAGRFDTIDVKAVYVTTASLVEDGDFDISDDPRATFANLVMSDGSGRLFTQFALGTTLLQLPLYLIGSGTADVLARAQVRVPADYVREFLIGLLSPLFGALLGLGLYRLGRDLGVAARPAVVTVLVALFASPLWPYAKSAFFEGAQAFFLTFGVLYLLRLAAGARDPVRTAVVGGSAVAALLLLKPAFVVIVPVLLAYPLLRRPEFVRRRQHWATLVALLSPIVAAGLATLIFNALRFGHPLQSGYDDPFTSDVLGGLWHRVASAEEGLIPYAPIVILAVAAVPLVPKALRGVLVWLGLIVLVHLLLYSAYGFQTFTGWGPRYLVPVLALLLVPLFWLVSSWSKLRAPVRAVVLVVVCASTLLQLLPFTNPFDQIAVLQGELRQAYPGAVAAGEFVSPIHALVELLEPKLRGEPPVYNPRDFGIPANVRLDHSRYEAMSTFNFWFVFAARQLGTPLPYLVFVAGLLLTAVVGWRLIHVTQLTASGVMVSRR